MIDDTGSESSIDTERGDECTFPFQALPPEIRNMIYTYALVGNGSIYITKTNCELEHGSSQHMRVHNCIGYFDYTRDEIVDDIITSEITPGLVMVHPTLVSEAQAVLYSKNQFILHGLHTLINFLEVIGVNSRCYLRNVEIIDCCHEDIDGAAGQVAMGLLSEATKLNHFHLGINASFPFVTDPKDRAGFGLQKEDRVKQMAEYLSASIARVFRAQRTTAEDFLNIFSVHPTSFEFCDHLPRMPFLKWETPAQFRHFLPCMDFTAFQRAAAELRAAMKPLLEVEAKIKIRQCEPWGANNAKPTKARPKRKKKAR